jgi:hypothetical protein
VSLAARPTTVKLLLVVAGLVAFGWGVRTESRHFRWAGIAIVAVAAALRIWRTPSPPRVDDAASHDAASEDGD